MQQSLELRKTLNKDLYNDLMDIFGQSYAMDLSDEEEDLNEE